MKKILLYTGLFLFILGFTACDEDFKDWAEPQSNSPEEATGAKKAIFTAGKDAVVIVDTAVGDSVELANVSSSSAEEGSELVFSSVTVNEKYSLPFSGNKGVLKVAIEDIDSITQLAYLSRASVERELRLDLKATEKTVSGEGLLLTGESVMVKLTPATTPEVDPNGYYIVGDITEWNATGAKPMIQDAEDENLFTFDIELTEGGKNFKIFPASAITTDVNWSKALGSKENEDDSSEGFIYWQEENEAGAIQIANGGKIRITFDAFNYRYTVKDTSAPDEIYMTGSAYDWGGQWKPFTAVHSEKGAFWSIAYFSVDEEVKFAPQPSWGGDFGYSETSISQESIDRAGLVNSGGNIKITKEGWYIVSVSVIGDDKVVEFYEPKVYLIGETTQGGWDAQLTENDLFVVPSGADGEFVSPGFAKDAELRICISITGKDWWRTEFIILDGSIAFRGNGGDQERVNVTAGQKAYLKFKDGTGRIE